MNNNQHFRCRHIGGLLLFLLLISLCGCSPSAKSEKEIIVDLQESLSSSDNTDVKVIDYSIIKRQTDAKNKTDTIYINTTTEDDLVLWKCSYVMTYGLYNEGWVLDEIVGYDEASWTFQPLQGVSDDVIQGYIDIYREDNMFDSIEVIDRITTLQENLGNDFVAFQAVKEHLYATEILEFSQTWYFDEYTCSFYVTGSPLQTDRTIILKENIVGAMWSGLARYYGTQNLFADQFDIYAESLSADVGLTLNIVKKDVWGAYWDRLDAPPENLATIVCPELTYFNDSEEVGIALFNLADMLYSPGDDDNFDEDDYFIFDLNNPGKGKIQSIYGNQRDAAITKNVLSGKTRRDTAIEYVTSAAKTAGVTAYNPNNPICGVWISEQEDYDGIICIYPEGTICEYPIKIFSGYDPDFFMAGVYEQIGTWNWTYDNNCLFLHRDTRSYFWEIIWGEDDDIIEVKEENSLQPYYAYRVQF